MARRSVAEQLVQYLSAKRRQESGLWDMYRKCNTRLEQPLCPGVGPHEEIANLDHCPRDRSATNFLAFITGADTQNVEASVERFQHRFSLHQRSNSGSGAMLDVDSSPDRQLSVFTIRMQSVKCRSLHEAN